MERLVLWKSWIIPWIEPITAVTEIMNPRQLKNWREYHLSDSFLICFWAMCICMGKKTTKGPNPIAPRRERTSLKKGITMARTVANITKIVLQTNLNKLKRTITLPIMNEYSLFMKSESGHTMLAPISTIRKNGWPITCNQIFIADTLLDKNTQIY